MDQQQPEPIQAEPVGPAPLAYGRPARSWWKRPRWHMAIGLCLLAFGYGLTLTYWPGPPILMAAGGLLIGMSVPLPGDAD